MFEILIAKSLFMVLIFSGIPLLVCFAGGLVCGILQTVTQVQEQSLGFLVKFLSISALIFFFLPMVLRQLSLFIQELLSSFAVIGAM
jgi:type III secretory pathway component EscS